MSDNIPIEIQREILKSVPVKSLFQFRSVSKSWKSLIDSSQFIADYNACKSRPQRLFISYEDHNFRYEFDPKYVIIVDDDNFPLNKFPTTFPISMANSFEDRNKLRPVGSSQGLLCFWGSYYNGYNDSYREIAFIWNPAIRKSIAIDVPSLHESYATVGFGVCPKTNDPMLVVIADCNPIYRREKYRRVGVFTLSSRVWRRPRSNLPRKSIVFSAGESQFQVAIDGCIYWQPYYDRLVVSFDMTSEEFTEINLPKSFASPTSWSFWSISKLWGSLAVVDYDFEKPFCDIWMMGHGVPKSFTKLFTITNPNGFRLGFRMNGDLILKVIKTGDYKEPAVLEVYEPHTGHVKDLGIYAKPTSVFVMSYTETLLLLDQVDNQHIELKLQSL